MSTRNRSKIALLITSLALLALACQAGSSLLATPTPYPTYPPYPTPATGNSGTANTLAYSDDFSSERSGWDRYSGNEASTDYGDGVYRIMVTENNWITWANPGESFTDVRIEVDATFINGPVTENSYGVICRHQDVDNFYALLIASDGAYAIRKRVNGGDLEIISGEFYDFHDAIKEGQVTNHITAECIGDRIALYANGALIVEVLDSDIPSGDVGLIGTSFDTDQMEVHFDNFEVYVP